MDKGMDRDGLRAKMEKISNFWTELISLRKNLMLAIVLRLRGKMSMREGTFSAQELIGSFASLEVCCKKFEESLIKF
jgi:hypothetical protein